MDPDANLKEQLEISEMVYAGKASEDEIDRLAELVTSLHNWIICGGYLPKQWRHR